MEAQFDRYGDEYEQFVEQSIGWSGVDHAFFVEAKARHLLRLVRRYVGEPARARALDAGCGIGVTHRYLSGIGELHGVDASEVSISRAREENPEVEYAVADAASLPYDDGAFDVSFAIGLLHHIPSESRDAVVRELVRVAGALTVVFEHNPLNPLTRLAVDRCAFDEDAVLLRRAQTESLMRAAGLRVVDSRYILVAPWTGRATRALERLLSRVPAGAQYY